jgi:hypothetical protein
MKKPNFKALAFMGITGGVALCSSASASESLNNNNIDTSQLLAAGCGGKGGCGGGRLTAYQPHGCGGQQPQNHYNTEPVPGQPAQGGCQTMSPQSPQGGSYTAYQPHGCNSQQPQSYYNTGYTQGQPSGSCNAQGNPQSSCNARPQGGWNSSTPSQGYGQPQAGNISQWETNNKIASTTTTPTTTPNAKASEETHLLSQLTEEGKLIYKGLDPAGKALATQAITQAQGKSAEEKTQAVKAVAQKMSEKRAKANAPRS